MRMKKIFSLLLCLALMVTLLPGAAFAEDGEAVLTDPAQTETVVEEDQTPAQPATGLELAAGYAAGKTSANAETDVAAPQVEENASLFDKLMACSDLASAQALIEASSEDELNALTDEQSTQLEEKLAELAAQAAQAASAALTESATPENSEDGSAESAMEPIVSYTNVGPLLPAPAIHAPAMLQAPAMLMAAPFSAENGETPTTDGIVLNKKAEPNGDGTYTITLEAYATGASTTQVSTEPVDIVLVLDVSGSMDDCLAHGNTNCSTYTPVYADDLNINETYYIESYEYREVKYCNQSGYGHQHSPGWYINYTYYTYSHGNKIYQPKTSDSDTNQDHYQFYVRTECPKRIDSLKTAVNAFIDNVSTTSPTSQIAIVKFAGNSKADQGDEFYTYDGYRYNYSQIVKNLTAVNDSGKTTLKNAVNDLSPAGCTSSDYGMEHAKNIITNDPNKDRKKVVIMFTDGEPNRQSGFNKSVANSAIENAKSIKDTGATVYTIGVFSGANGTPVNSWSGVGNTNKYMHLVSSNYKDATSMDNPGDPTYPEGGKSYYLSAGNHEDLFNIFTQISQEVGGTTSELTDEAVLKDVITPAFVVENGVQDISYMVYDYKGGDYNNSKSWEEASPQPEGIVVSCETEGTEDDNEGEKTNVSVTGFNYSENWAGLANEEPRGKKLVITIKIKPRDKFLGGNGVPTNAGAGIYPDAETDTAVITAENQNVDVKIGEIKFTPSDAYVFLGAYLNDTVEETEVINATDVIIGGNKITFEDTTTPGVYEWQDNYVKVEAKVTAVGLENITDDVDYSVKVTVTPKGDGTTKAKEKSVEGTIHVFKPQVTFKDLEGYYGAEAPENGNAFVKTEWACEGKHPGDEGVKMLGSTVAPTLSFAYEPETGKIVDNKINSKKDIPVKVTVTMPIGAPAENQTPTNVTAYTTFVHQACNPACSWTEPAAKGDPAFLIHVKTCHLTVTKTGGAAGEPYVFDVYKDDDTENPYTQVTIVADANGTGNETIYELPVGTYTIKEADDWSWRYEDTTTLPENGKTLSSNNHTGTITCVNIKDSDYWLNGYSAVVKNVSGVSGRYEKGNEGGAN